jgi:hypothetical protein
MEGIIVEGVVSKTLHVVIKEFLETKKAKDTGEEFAMALIEDSKTGEKYKLIMTIEAFKELKEGDDLYLKYYYAKPDTYSKGAEEWVLSKGRHGQMIRVAKKRGT